MENSFSRCFIQFFLISKVVLPEEKVQIILGCVLKTMLFVVKFFLDTQITSLGKYKRGIGGYGERQKGHIAQKQIRSGF